MGNFKLGIVVACCLVSTSFPATAQSTVADSLRRHLNTIAANDTLYALNLLYLWIAEAQSNPEAALESAQKALDASRNIGWVRGEINALNSLALSKQRQGFYSEALQYYLPAVELSEKTGNKRHISKTHNNLGILYQLTSDYPKALTHFYRVLEVEDVPAVRASVFNNIGIVYKNTQQPDSALLYYYEALKTHQKADNVRGLAPAYNNIGIVLRDRKAYTEALKQFEQALQMYSSLNDQESCAVVMGSIGDVLSRLGRFQAARDTLEKAFKLAQSQRSLVAQQDISNYFQSLFEQQGQYQEAYKWLKSFKSFGDSLQNIQKRDELEAIRARFESDKKVALLEKDFALERTQRLLWTACAIGLLLLLGASGYALRQTRRRRRIESALQTQEIARLRAEDETRRLREEKLSEELGHRSRELTSQTLHLVQKNELLQTVAERLQEAGKAAQPNAVQLRTLQRLVEHNLNDNEQWEDFKRHFEAVHPDFFQRLLGFFPQLTAHDLRYCAYLRLNLSSKEIAALLNVSLRGVETHRHRLRKKLGVDGEQDLTAWAMRV
jgi:tetratricopeptide (TPR) repeat protein